MRKALWAAILLPVAALGGCATTPTASVGSELPGETLRMETQRGQVTLLRFNGDGTVNAQFGEKSIAGRWQVADGNLCFFWAGATRECWPYAAPFVTGQTRTITSDRGNVVKVTLQ